jgi:membrane protein implicated in regulation of membrane protease activity
MAILWWHWIVLGLVLALAELAAAGGFYIIFFGISALIVGLLASVGLAGPAWMQIVLFSVLSVGSLVAFRARLLKWLQVDPQAPGVDAIVGEIAVATEDLPPGGIGKVELRGSAWTARNTTGIPVVRGTRCRVIRIDGLTVHVEPEGAHA